MKKPDSFTQYIIDQLSLLGDIQAKRLFSSFGLYCADCFFAISHHGSLYLKTNEKTKQKYLALGMKPFVPTEKQVLKNYFEVPGEIIEDSPALVEWASEAISLGLLKSTKKRKQSQANSKPNH